jgi:uncharacterized OB-fold protein
VAGIPPAVTAETAAFWQAAADGRLVAERCTACGAQSFPPRGACRSCRGRQVAPSEVTGRGVVYSLTVNHQRWLPELPVPFCIVLAEFPDHPGVRVAGRLRGCAPQDAFIGMAVEIGFEPGPGGFAIPSFTALPPARQAPMSERSGAAAPGLSGATEERGSGAREGTAPTAPDASGKHSERGAQ